MSRRRSGVSPMAAAITIVGLLGAVAVGVSLMGNDAGVAQFAPVSMTGTPLVAEGASPDAAVGRQIPQVRGVDFDGSAVAITLDGRPKAITFLAHWCPHCERELPRVVAWLTDTGGVPGVDLYAVSTRASATRPNWPPSAWFAREGWVPPVLVDDEASSVAAAFGLSGTPMWVFVRADGTVARRIAGEVPVAMLEAQMRALLAPPQ